MSEQITYDFLIVGAGCAGASGAMYAARLNMKTAMIAELPGGLITTTHLVENWPGTKSISGPDLAMSILDHAMQYNVPMINEKVIDVKKAVENAGDGRKSGFIVKTASNTYKAKSVLLATGSEHRKLAAKGEKEFTNRGVSYCALCDAGFYKNKIVSVVGGGDSAVKEAILLSEHCSKVYLIVRRDVLRAEVTNREQLNKLTATGKIDVKFNTEIEEIKGSDKVEKVLFKSGEEIPMDGIFVAVGHLPASELAAGLGVSVNDRAEIITDRNSRTNVPGVYAAGDVTDNAFKQAIVGAAAGVTAAFFAYDYVSKETIILE
jgi:thioredoxin reductase (NADPH)